MAEKLTITEQSSTIGPAENMLPLRSPGHVPATDSRAYPSCAVKEKLSEAPSSTVWAAERIVPHGRRGGHRMGYNGLIPDSLVPKCAVPIDLAAHIFDSPRRMKLTGHE